MKKKTFWMIVLAILAVDRITKELAPGIPADGLALIPGVIGLRYAENTGIAFSLLSGVPRLTGILGLAVVTGGYVWLRKKKIAPFPLAGLALMAGGALGNMADRLVRGFVPDMIETLFVKSRPTTFDLVEDCFPKKEKKPSNE